MKSCCVYKRPFEHVGPFTCPMCHETSVPMTNEQFRKGLEAIRAMFERPAVDESTEDKRAEAK